MPSGKVPTKVKKFIEFFEREYQIKIKSPELVFLSLRHSSLSKNKRKMDNNERLEFLGDAILNGIVSILLFEKFRKLNEGDLSRIKSYLVSSSSLSKLAKKINLQKYIMMSKSTEKAGGRNNNKIISSTFEALVGALFLQTQFETVYTFLEKMLRDKLNGIASPDDFIDHKTKLQEYSQKIFKEKPVYRLISEKGPDHRKRFQVEVEVGGQILGKGFGKNKKEAQQNAASEALRTIEKSNN